MRAAIGDRTRRWPAHASLIGAMNPSCEHLSTFSKRAALTPRGKGLAQPERLIPREDFVDQLALRCRRA